MPVRMAGELMATEQRTFIAEHAPSSADDPVVVVDEQGRPRWIVGQNGPGPAVLLPPDTPITALSVMPGVLKLLEGGLPGVLVCDAERLIGFVSRETVIAELLQAIDNDGDAIGTVLDGSDFELYGYRDPAPDPIRIKCAACGVVSSVAEFPPPNGICPNGLDHMFVADWTV